jgi:hypothetical protein
MSRRALFGNAVLATIAAACVPIFLVACFAFRYPAIHYVSGVNVATPPPDVRCFRVDVCLEKEHGLFVSSDDGQRVEDGTLVFTEVAVSAAGTVNGQARFALDYTWRGLYSEGTDRHIVLLHLYRPGYQLVEVSSADNLDVATWKEAPDLAMQEKAIDDLLSIDIAGPSGRFSQFLTRVPCKFGSGSTYPRHKLALLFAAAEYERLAIAHDAESPGHREQRAHLNDKAKWIRDWAEKGVWGPLASPSSLKSPVNSILLTAFP